MSVKVEQVEKNVVKLEMTVDMDTFERGMQKSYLHNVKKFNIPGFRKGKAPRKIIERYYGENVFYEDAINFVCPDVYDKALEQENIDVVAEPEFDIVQIGEGKELIFSAQVTVKPEVKLGKYKGLEVEEKEIVVSEEDINKELETMGEKNSRLVSIDDRNVQKDDIATIDFEGFVDDVAFEGGKGENYELTIGSGQFIPGFEEQLIGVKLGEEVDVKVTFPEEYHSADLQAKDAIFKVTVKEIKVKELPKLDDEFAKDVSEFDTLAELKKDIKEKLHHEAEHKAKHDMEDELIKKACENTEVEIPQVMIDSEVKAMIKDFDMRLSYQGLNLEKYLQFTNTSFKDFKETLIPQANERVLGRLMLEAVAKAEEFEASEEELDAQIEKLANNYKQNILDFKKQLRTEDIKYIKESVIFDRVIEFLVTNSVSSSKKTKQK